MLDPGAWRSNRYTMSAPFRTITEAASKKRLQVPAPEHRSDQPQAEDHAHRREDHRGDPERMGEQVVNVAPGQGAADGDVDPIDDPDGSLDGHHDGPDVM